MYNRYLYFSLWGLKVARELAIENGVGSLNHPSSMLLPQPNYYLQSLQFWSKSQVHANYRFPTTCLCDNSKSGTAMAARGCPSRGPSSTQVSSTRALKPSPELAGPHAPAQWLPGTPTSSPPEGKRLDLTNTSCCNSSVPTLGVCLWAW